MDSHPSAEIGDLVKHWLLNLVIKRPIPLNLILPTVESVGLNVKPVPRCRPEHYAQGLIELLDRRMIKLSSEVAEELVEIPTGGSRILDRLLTLSKEGCVGPSVRPDPHSSPEHGIEEPSGDVYFELTGLGGEAWESIAKPDWTHILTASRDPSSPGLVSPSRDLLMAHMGWHPELCNRQIRVETVEWHTHSDFQMLYWKRLPFVYRVSFMSERAQPRWGNKAREPKWFQDWWIYSQSWCKKPWELPEWPSE